MANQPSPEQKPDPKRTFTEFDEGQDKKITADESRAAKRILQSREPTDAELGALAKEANTDSNGTIKPSECPSSTGGMTSNDMSKEEMRAPSPAHDKDGDGHTTTTEMPDKLSQEQKSELQKIFQHFDKDGDGELAADELRAALRTLRGSEPTNAELQDLVEEMRGRTSDKEDEEMYDEDTTEMLSPEQMLDLKKTFDLFDKDHDEKLTIDELRAAMHTLLGRDLTDAELRGLVMEVDTDYNGTIEFSEFLALMGRRTSNDASKEDMRRLFGSYDKDGNGYITVTELRQVMAELGNEITDEDAEDMISGSDLDGDGRINFEEFVEMMQPA